jgi:hypothetical protein
MQQRYSELINEGGGHGWIAQPFPPHALAQYLPRLAAMLFESGRLQAS